MYGVVCALLRVPEEHTVASFLFGTLRTMVASTVRLGVTGTLEVRAFSHTPVSQCTTENLMNVHVKYSVQ